MIYIIKIQTLGDLTSAGKLLLLPGRALTTLFNLFDLDYRLFHIDADGVYVGLQPAKNESTRSRTATLCLSVQSA